MIQPYEVGFGTVTATVDAIAVPFRRFSTVVRPQDLAADSNAARLPTDNLNRILLADSRLFK